VLIAPAGYSAAAKTETETIEAEAGVEAPTPVDYISLLQDYNGLPIVTIEFQGSKDVEEDLLCATLTLGEGDTFSAEQAEASRLELLDLDKFSSASIEVSEKADGLIVRFVLQEKWHVMSVPLMPKKARNKAACKSKLSSLSLTELEGLPIEAIVITGNKTTRDIVLRAEMLFHEGDTFSVNKMLQSRQSIKNLGLFKMVWVRAEKGEEGAIVTFSVSEKWYILPLPTLSRNTDGDLSYGGELTWENTFGLNHRLNFELQQEDKADGDTEQSVSLDYRIPKIYGTRYGFETGLSRKRTLQDGIDENDETVGKVFLYEDELALGTSRWFKRITPSQGWIGGISARWLRNYYDVSEGNPLLEDDFRELNLGLSGGFTAIDDFEFYRSGQEYGAGLGTGHHALGSTDTYVNLGFYWRRYQPLQIPVRANLNTQLQFGVNHGRDDEFELGGADSLRGILDKNKLNGDMFAVLNLNWLIPLPNYPAFRWNIFTDVGNTWDRGDFNPFNLENTFGVGARWRIRALVNSTLRLDIAFNPATGGFKIYAGTSNMF
jgi:outer membrane protein assembly factor BamA